MSCSNCKIDGHTILKCNQACGRCGSSDHKIRDTKSGFICRYDAYSANDLCERFYAVKQLFLEAIAFKNKMSAKGIPIRLDNIPSDISENIVKFILFNKTADKSIVYCRSVGLPGDLNSLCDGIIECKCFTSDGPSSFGPKKVFNVIYFLDMRMWLSDKFILWKVNLSDKSPEWKSIKMNSEQTNEEQCDQNRRPHISWENIKSQLPADKVSKVFEGSFDDIFKEEAPTVPQ